MSRRPQQNQANSPRSEVPFVHEPKHLRRERIREGKEKGENSLTRPTCHNDGAGRLASNTVADGNQP